MADNVKPRVKAPGTARAGEVVAVKTLITHRMESGLRRDADGRTVPRLIVNRLQATFEGETVIEVTIAPAVAANPYFEFPLKVERSGTLTVTWRDDDGATYTASQAIVVAAKSR